MRMSKCLPLLSSSMTSSPKKNRERNDRGREKMEKMEKEKAGQGYREIPVTLD